MRHVRFIVRRQAAGLMLLAATMISPTSMRVAEADSFPPEHQLTSGPGGRILTNCGVWSPDSAWIAYDVRSDPAGSVFDGNRIERVQIASGKVEVLYESRRGACCGVVTWHPHLERVIFIHGPEDPTQDWQYSAAHRRGVWVDAARPGVSFNLDARDLTPPFTPGALRGGSHVHVFSPDGAAVSFTYEDDVLGRFAEPGPEHDVNQRNVGISVPRGPVRVSHAHPRNHDGEWFTVLVTRTTAEPQPGSDEISRACEEGWVGTHGYLRRDGSRQRRALAFQGTVRTRKGKPLVEVFVVDLPEDLTRPGVGPLAGTEQRMPSPPAGVIQRRLTFTEDRVYPGVDGPRHWLRSSPDGSQIAFLARDDAGVVQLWAVSPQGGRPRQITRNPWPIASAFTWSPDGRLIAHVMDGSVFVTDAETGFGRRLTPRRAEVTAPRPEACVFAPDGRKIAYVRQMPDGDASFNQIFVVEVD